MRGYDRETELKLDVKRDALPRLEASELLTNNEAISKSIPSVYFDTDRFDLRDAGSSRWLLTELGELMPHGMRQKNSMTK